MKSFKNIYRILLIVIAVTMATMSLNHGITGDEDDASAYGKAIISYMTTLGEDTTALSMPEYLDKDHLLHLYGGAFDMTAATVHKVLPFMNEFTLRHILNALMGFLAIFFASRIVLLFSNYRAATIVALLMFLFPFFLGHSMNNPKDVPFSAAYIMAIYFIIRFWQSYPAVKIKDYAFVILSIALALNIRIAAFLLFAYLGLFMVVSILPNLKENLKKILNLKTALTYIGICIAAYFIAVLFWPFALQDPLNNPFVALDTFSNLDISLAQIWEGTKIASAELPWYYVPKAILITSPYVFLLGLILFGVFIFSMRKEKHFYLILFVAFTGFFPILYVVYKSSNIFHLWRHILFVFPSIAIIAAIGWERLIAFFEAKEKPVLKFAPLVLLALMLLEPLYFVAKHQPNEVNYFNAFVGGPKEAYYNYEFDYYYNGLKPSVDYFIENVAKKTPLTDTVVLTTNAHHLLRCYLVDYPNVKIKYNRYYELNTSEWDYNILHKALVPLEKLTSGSWLPEKHTLYQNNMMDLPLSALIKRPSNEDIKGNAFLSQNKIPEAIESFKKYLTQDPMNTSIRKSLGNAYLQVSDIENAYNNLKYAYDKEPTDLEAQYLFGTISIRKNDFATAANLLTQVTNTNPQFLPAYLQLGIAQKGLGQVNEALSSLNSASRSPQIAAMAYKLMGDIYMQQGNTEQANKLYQLSKAGKAQ